MLALCFMLSSPYYPNSYAGIIDSSLKPSRLVPIVLLKLSIMLWSNASEFCLLCSIYAPYVEHYALQIQQFLFLLSYLNYKIMSIGSLSSSSTVQCTINHSSKDVYKHFEFIFVAFATSFNTKIDKIIYHRFTQISQSCKNCAFCTNCVNCNCAGNCCLLCWHNRLKPNYEYLS